MIIRGLKTNLSVCAWLRFDLNFVYEKALLWQRNESMVNFFLSASNSCPIYNISITSGFYLISLTSEDKYMQWPKAEELKNELFLYVKTLRFTIGIINKNWIIPTEYLRPTSFGLNDIDNIDEVVKVNFGLLSKKAKRWLKLFELDYWKSEGNITHFCFSIKVSRVWSYKVVSVWRKGRDGYMYYRIRWTAVLLPKTSKT